MNGRLKIGCPILIAIIVSRKKIAKSIYCNAKLSLKIFKKQKCNNQFIIEEKESA
jgi:hypothetical protein